MTRIPSTNLLGNSSQTSGLPRSINDLDLSTFLDLMIAELQNQDPLNPMDNKDMLAQISQLREVGATDRLTKTLDSVLLGQNITSATNLIGADISALSNDGKNVEGNVRRVEISDSSPKLHVEEVVGATGAGGEGNIEAGKYNYRILWQDEAGKMWGIELSGATAVTTTGKDGIDRAIELNNLPDTPGPKQIYRTDGKGHEPYRLVGVIDGSASSMVDRLSDEERMDVEFDRWQEVYRSTNISRSYEVKLENIRDIRPPRTSSGTLAETP
jgi:flagellar basal-body rod modification protein FlgD